MSGVHTPGPWGWFGNQHGFYLATPDRGRRYIMGFRRHGLQGAQPTFQERSIMVPAAELVKFAVGDGTARGMVEGRADPSVYRYDIKEIDHPDARLIAAAPDLLAALVEVDKHFGPFADITINGQHDADDVRVVALVRAAIAKATLSAASPTAPLSDGSTLARSRHAPIEARDGEGSAPHALPGSAGL